MALQGTTYNKQRKSPDERSSVSEPHCNRQGFTLIEMVMVIVVLGIIGLITFKVLFSGVQTFVLSRERQDLYDQGRMAMERMVREIRVASQIAYPTLGNSGTYLNFSKATYTYATGAPFDASTVLTYRLNGTSLERSGNVSGNAVIASGLAAFTVTHLTGDYMSLELSLSSTKGGTLSLRTEVYPRDLP
jgi:prepilin-type N-terminal cleavage/methylation domain-containing protein